MSGILECGIASICLNGGRQVVDGDNCQFYLKHRFRDCCMWYVEGTGMCQCIECLKYWWEAESEVNVVDTVN